MTHPNGIIDSGTTTKNISESQPVEEIRPAAAERERIRSRLVWLWDILLVGVLVMGTYFRFVGVNWDANQHLHPDERFLTMVETSIQPVKSLGEYFNTDESTLNPSNRGYGFFVYGTLPLFIVRYAGEWLGETGYDQIHLVGRQISAVMDLGTVLMVYLIAARLFRSRPLALLASTFAALSVLPIQLSHYFTVDTFTNFFGMLAVYFAVKVLPTGDEDVQPTSARPHGQDPSLWLLEDWKSAVSFVLFGAALGMAMASKINAALVAVLLPAAVVILYLSRPPAERPRLRVIGLRNLVIAAAVTVLVFRVFQPYAFSGPGFFNILPNPQWIQSLRDLANQSTGDVDFPPALQWARRPIWFSLQNMVLWGLGLPLGLLAWAGFAWLGWRILQRLVLKPVLPDRWAAHPVTNSLLIWGWTAVYFAYQSYNFTRSMRYQMLVYPTLAILAAWAVFELWERGRGRFARFNGPRTAAVATGLVVVTLTLAWAFAFTRIYDRPMTRVAASQWIYQNVPGPINLRITTDTGDVNQPVAFGSGFTLRAGEAPLVLAFRPDRAGTLYDLEFEHIGGLNPDGRIKNLSISISESSDGANTPAATNLVDSFLADGGDPRGKTYSAQFGLPPTLSPEKTYYLILRLDEQSDSLSFAGPITLGFLAGAELVRLPLPEPVEALRAGEAYQVPFTSIHEGMLHEIHLEHVVDWEASPDAKSLRLSIIDLDNGQQVAGQVEMEAVFAPGSDVRGGTYVLKFAEPVALRKRGAYLLSVEHAEGTGRLAVYGSKQANESSWDDALPVSLNGLNPYDYYQGIYRSDLNFELYWDDNEEKRERFQTVLDQADYIFISSNRQWGTTTRVPERYPLTSLYYRSLLGCPVEREITWCYSVAEPGMFQGSLGYELAAVFQSDPNLGSLRFNTQFAEEAFTVYDHPKVLIFRKTAGYDSDQVRALLDSVDLSTVVHLTPRKAASYPGNLMLPDGRLAQQRAGGTWSDLFDTGALYNRYPGLAAGFWYVVIAVLGWVCYPLTRLALHGLPDRGYPFARLVGLLVLAWLVWVLGSLGVPFSRLTISLVFAGLLLVNLALAYAQRKTLAEELRTRSGYFLRVELLFLAFFVLFLLVRLGNSDLWHPYKGGEKPMDFSYFNAVLKSTTFPPYDPWFAGGYINYYYYGYVIVGVPVKWLGIVPSIAYNLILPTLFALLAAGAFSMGWNITAALLRNSFAGKMRMKDESPAQPSTRPAYFAGLISALTLTVFGNWGTVRMIWHGVQRLAPMQVPFEEASLLTHLVWTFQGVARLLSGARLPYGPSDWYWIPSRAIPGTVITEFPSFTFLYADLHAHMIALPVTVLAAAWALSIVLSRWGWKGWGHLLTSFLLGGLVIGALKPTNTWDWPTFLALGSVAIVFTALRYGQICCFEIPGVSLQIKRILIALSGVGLLFLLSTLMYKPFADWYGQAYDQIVPWNEGRTPFWSYMTHWGLFLFVITAWMAWEAIDWMASTPISALNRLRPWMGLIRAAGMVLAVLIVALLVMGVWIGWLTLLLAALAGVLLLRPHLPDAKRVVLFMTGTALVLTLFVEVARLDGDVGRMNTVFKFYLQAWTLFSLGVGAALVWLWNAAAHWRMAWKFSLQTALAVLFVGALLFPIMAGFDKITDRMAPDAPRTLDGTTYMAYARHWEAEFELDLSEDYRAIRWMQENVSGSPVILEAHLGEYHWGNRFTQYTGLPSVVGWNWHQRQQRALTPDTWVWDRVRSVENVYNSNNRAVVVDFLRKYNVRYIVVGQTERAVYSQVGLAKFENWNGDLWQEVYRDGQTAIYEVRDEGLGPVAYR